MASENERSAGKTFLPITMRGSLVLALPAIVLLTAMAVTWNTLLEEGRARRDLAELVAVQNDVAATASVVRRVANGLDLFLAAGLRGDLMPYHLASERLSSLDAAIRSRTEDLPAPERDALRRQVETISRETLTRLQAVDEAIVPLDRAHPVISHDMRQAADALVSSHMQAIRARTTTLIELHERRVSMMLWGGGAALFASLLAIAWFLVRVARPIDVLVTNGSQLAAGLPLLALPSGRDEIGRLAQDFGHARDLLRQCEEELLNSLGRQRYLEAALRAITHEPAREGRFLAQADAELRNPLTVIVSSAELLKDTPLTPDQRTSADAIERSAKLLAEFLTETVELARADANEVATELRPENVALEAVVRDIVQHVGPDRGSSIDVNIDPALAVYADQRRLAVIVEALVSNAVKFNRPEGHVRISAAARPDGSVRLAIQDEGPGIRREDVGRLFAPFGRVAQSAGAKGTGLGLAMVKRLVDLMGGAVGVESEPGAGSTFWIQFPRADRPAVPAPVVAGASMVNSPAQALRSVLYIEDLDEMARLLQRILRSRPDLRLVSAPTGAEGLTFAVAERPALILLDLNLPDLPGDQVLQRIKADPRIRDIPVVIVSGVADEKRLSDLIAAGASGYLVKPFRVAQILAVLPPAHSQS